MNKIDVTKWKAFTIEDLFNKCELKYKKEKFNKASDISTMQTEEFNLPLVNAKHFNNGIMYYGRSSDFESESMTIDIVADGAASTGDVYAQPQETGVLYNAYLIKPKFVPTESILLYFSTVIQTSIKEKFGYENKCTWDKVKHIEILLPVTNANTPDYEYMESYMKNIMQESEKNIEKLSNISKSRTNISTENWINFDCSKLFTAVNTGNILARDIEDGSGYTPYVTASGINNGVVAHIDASKYDIIKGHCILIGGKTFTVTYQADDFVSNDSHNFVIRTNKYDISDLAYKYLVTIISSYFGQKYSWNDAVTKDKFLYEMIPLPANANGEPDWKYMEQYMKNHMEDTKSKLDKLVCC